MRTRLRSFREFVILFIASIALFSSNTFSQVPASANKARAIKFDEIGVAEPCELIDRFNRFFVELSNKPNSQGFIINYNSTLEPDVDYLAQRERLITNALAFRNFDRSRITLVRGGWKKTPTTELWLVPAGAENPRPSPTEPDRSVTKGQLAEIFDSNNLATRTSNLQEFVLEKAKAEMDEDDDSDVEPDGDPTESDPKNLIGRDRFRWANVYIPVDLTKLEGAGVDIVFFADEEKYDIDRLKNFVEQGRDILAAAAKVPRNLLIVEYGGFREEPEVEFWFVPAGVRRQKPAPIPKCEQAEPH